MPEKKFALEQDGAKRLRVVSNLFSTRYTLYFDGQLIGDMDDAKELKKGRTFTLPDGSKLNVRKQSSLVSTELQLLRNGVPLPESDADPQKRLDNAYYTIYAIGVINVVGGILLLLTQSNSLGGMELDFISVIATGIIYLVLGYFVQRRSQIALGITVIGFLIDSLGILLLGVVGPGPLVARFFFLMPMLKGFGAIRDLNNPPPVQNKDFTPAQAETSTFKSFLDEIANDPIPGKPTAAKKLSAAKKPAPAKKGMLESFTRLELALAAVAAFLIVLVIGFFIGTALVKPTAVTVGVLPTQMVAPTLPPVWTPTITPTATLPPLVSTPTPASDFAATAIINEQTPVIPAPETNQNSADSIPIQNDLQKIVFDPAGTMAYGLDYTNQKVWFIDLEQKTVSASLGLSGSPIDACIHPSQRRLYVVNMGTPTITEIDMDTKLMIRELTWPAPNEAWNDEIRPFNIICQQDRLMLLDATHAPKPWMIDLTVPNSFAQTFTTSKFQVESTVYEMGIGDWVFTSDPNEFYFWFQFGWDAGYGGSEILHARLDGSQMLNLDGAGFSYNDYDRFGRDPLDTPVFLDETNKRLIAKRVVVNSENLAEIQYIFPSGQEIYAVDWGRNLAASKKGVYDLNTFRTTLAFDGVTPDQVYFAPDGRLYLLSNGTDMLYSLTLAGTTEPQNEAVSSQTNVQATLQPTAVPVVEAETGMIPLAFTIFDGDYSDALDAMVLVSSEPNALHIYNPETGDDRVINLEESPTGFAISPDGRYAAIGHAQKLSYIDLTTQEAATTVALNLEVVSISVGNNGRAYAVGPTPQDSLQPPVPLQMVDFTTGKVTSEELPKVAGGDNYQSILALNTRNLYLINESFIYRLALDNSGHTGGLNTERNISSDPSKLNLSEDGKFLFTGYDSVLLLSDELADDLYVIALLDNRGGNSTIAAQSFGSDWIARGRLDGSIELWDSSSLPLDTKSYMLNLEAEATVPPLPNSALGRGFEMQHLMVNRAGTRYYTIFHHNDTYAPVGFDFGLIARNMPEGS